jgi:hypothetical protein
MAVIRQGLIGNPVIQGLLGGGGPAAIKAAKNKALFEAMPRGQAVRMSAPGAIVRPPDNSMGEGLSAFGKALGDIADMKAESAAQKDLAALFEPTVVGEPGTGESMTVQPKVGSKQLATFLAKHIKAPNASKQARVLYDNARSEEREQRDRQFRRSERIAGQEYSTGERVGGQNFRTDERKDSQNFRTDERKEGQKFQTGERQGGQNFRTDERIGGQNFRTDERKEGQKFQTGERQAKDKAALERQLLKQKGVKGTLNQVHFANGVVKSILRENNQDFIINDDGKRVPVEAALRDNKGAFIAKPEDFTPSATEKNTVAKATKEVGTAEAEVKTISNIVRLVKENSDNVGFAGDIKASLVNVGGILQDIVGENKFTDFGVGLVGGQRDKDFLNNLDSRSEKLKEAMLRLRQRAKGRAATANEIKEITALTNLRQWAGSEKLTANIQEIERRLKEDLSIINKGNTAAGFTASSPTRGTFTWSKK